MPINLQEIPKVFYSDLTGAPFQKCTLCECQLAHSDEDYVIEKAIKPYDGYNTYATIFEYAMCISCIDTMKSIISKESAQKMDAYFKEKMDMSDRKKLMEKDERVEVLDLINNCAITGDDVKDIPECQIYAQCHGDFLVVHDLPYMIGFKALDEMMQLLSAKTLDDLNNFQSTLTDGPPELEELFKSGPRVFI